MTNQLTFENSCESLKKRLIIRSLVSYLDEDEEVWQGFFLPHERENTLTMNHPTFILANSSNCREA